MSTAISRVPAATTLHDMRSSGPPMDRGTGHQVRGCRPLALSRHCVCSGLWLQVVGSPPVCLPGGMGLAREKEKMVLFVWRNGTKFLLYLTLLAMCDIPPLLQNKY